jgi:peptide/nickel transport system permease protein
LRSHILPHIVPVIIVYATLGIATNVLFEAALSFLGVGVQPPTPSWGAMISEGQSYYRSAPWLVIFPGLAIMLTVLSFNLLGDGLRDALDPVQRN